MRIELERLEVNSDYKGYGIYRIFLCLLLQFLEDLSDRELERFIAENASAKWFCQDATHLISKVGLWKERKAIELKLESLNNKTLEKVAADKDAKFGAKSKDKIWFGYKQHTSVDMQSGMINKVAITPANVIDSKGFKHNKRVQISRNRQKSVLRLHAGDYF